MLFSIDAHTIGCHLTGNEVYISNLLNQYSGLDRDAEFIAYIAKPNASNSVPTGMRREQVSENPFKRLGFDIPRLLRRDRPSLLHVQYTAPLFCRTPLVVSVHDVSYLEHPEYFTRFRAMQLKYTVKRTVRQAARILTPSEFSKRSILAAYDVPDHKVVVVPNAVSSTFRPVPREAAMHWVERERQIPGPFVLMVGDLQPRKNHLGLIRAFEDVIGAHPHLPHSLVMVGKETWYAPVVRRAAEASKVRDRIHFTGWVSDADLRRFYSACDMLAFPSFYEGFGLPILEAMACGRAVACSNTSAMPEVANAAGILFDPYSTEEIARAISDLLLDPELRLRMERLGAHRASMFSWTRSAEKTLEVYYEVAGGRKAKTAAAKQARRAVPAVRSYSPK
jgi:glycosyltransferase involved in cell wall biosynthesis